VNEFSLDDAEHALDLLRAGRIEGAAVIDLRR
jgi:D-arabinose 1-dehydrogenase-like Zn-dependent alcohol dehydrogenase